MALGFIPRNLILAGVALATVSAAAGFVLGRWVEENVYNPKLSLAKNIEGCEQKSRSKTAGCYDRLFQDYLVANEAEGLLRAFNGAMAESPGIRRACHQITHAIGRAVFDHPRDITEIFRLDRSLDACAGGFYHGVVEKLFRPDSNLPAEQHISSGELRSKIPAVCDQFEAFGRRAECIHGIGHGAMFLLHDIGRALDACTVLPDEDRRFFCYGGAFMEYTISGRAAEESPRDPHAPCRGLADPHRDACYYVHAFRLVELGLSGQVLIAECQKVPRPADDLCVRGYVVFFLAHQALAEGPRPVAEFCARLDPPYGRICAEGVSGRLASITTDGSRAMPFCMIFQDQRLRQPCLDSIVRALHKEGLDPAAIRKN